MSTSPWTGARRWRTARACLNASRARRCSPTSRGFTPLTEALARELGPQRGSEEITRHLNLVYDAVIAEVHGHGGSVIGFSGDAITCWFDQDNGLRAAACGLAMQEAMARFAHVAVPSGQTITLAMKASIACGPARRFLVGDPE